MNDFETLKKQLIRDEGNVLDLVMAADQAPHIGPRPFDQTRAFGLLAVISSPNGEGKKGRRTTLAAHAGKAR